MKTRKTRTSIRREGWYYLFVIAFVLAGAILREINLLLVLSGMMIGPLLVNWRIAVAALKKLDVHRTLPAAVHAGDLLSVRLDVTNNNRRLGASAVAVDNTIELRSADESDPGGGVLFAHVAAGQSASAIYRGRPPRRGRCRFGPLVVSTSFPLGLVRRRVTLGEADEVIVYPRLGKLTRAFRQLQRQIQGDGARSRGRRGLNEGDFYGLRDWRSGDSRRSIHWRTTARTGALAVRQMEQRADDDLALVVDLWSPEAPDAKFLRHVEQLISFAATIVAERCRIGGGRLLLAVGGTTITITRGTASPTLLREAMRHLALGEPNSVRRLDNLLREALGQSRRSRNVLLLSTCPVDLQPGDLQNDQQLSALWDDPVLADRLHHLRRLDLSGGRLSEYFDVE